MRKVYHIGFLLLFLLPFPVSSQGFLDAHRGINEKVSPIIIGNGISDIMFHNGSIWIGTGSGVGRSDDGGSVWNNFDSMDGIGKNSISAMGFMGNTIWIATSFDTLTPEGTVLPAGGGLSYSEDNGMTWEFLGQPGVTPVQNITFDIAFIEDAIWITSWGGGLKRSTNMGQSWQDIPPDDSPFDPFQYLNHRAFSAVYADNVLWVGTAKGINRSTDKGETWVNFNHQNQSEPISGNFVVALAHQKWKNRSIIWAATIEAESEGEVRAVSYSFDFGFTWKTTLEGKFPHNFAFDDSVVYVASETGLYKSIDLGETWASFTDIVDNSSGARLFTEDVFSAGVSEDAALWVGSSDGLARTTDNGVSWKIFRAFEPLTDNQNVSETYAYPNPFSPLRHNQVIGEGHVRFHYRVKSSGNVSVSVYDFAMALVRRVEEGVFRMGDSDYDAVWDGRNDFGERVANGLYFYRVDLPGSQPVWGKLIVMD